MTAPATVPELLARRASSEPDRTALWVDGRWRLTFAEWDRCSGAVARGLHRLGVGRGDRVGLLFGSRGWIEYAIAYLAVHKVAAAAVHLSDQLAPDQLRHRLASAAVSLVLAGEGLCEEGLSGEALSGPPGVRRSTLAALDRGAAGPAGAAPGPGDLADIAFTSGTTSGPRPIAVTHGNLTHGRGGGPDERLFPDEQVFLSAWAMGTNASQATVISALTAHPTVLATSSLRPDHVGALVARTGAGGVMLPPSLAVRLAHARLAQRHDLSGVHAIGTGSALVAAPVRRMLAELFPHAAINIMYSSAEASPAFTGIVVPPWRQHRDRITYQHGPAATSVGRPGRDTRLRIAGSAGEPVPAGTLGEVWLGSPAPPRAYFRDRERTSRVFADGWTRTGDLGHLDDDGFLYLFDRAAEVVVCHGQRVSTFAVEACLYQHPAVLEAAAFAVPDPVAGQAVAVAVVPRSPVTATDLSRFTARCLPEPSRPVLVRLVESLPRNLMGKVVKSQLQRQADPLAGRAAG